MSGEVPTDGNHGPVASTWFGRGMWPTCQCGFDPHDNAVLDAHWAEHGFKVVDEHGRLVKHPAPVLPYAGTSGWSGSSTSESSTRDQDEDGRTADKQQAALSILDAPRQSPLPGGAPWRRMGREHGLTWRELDVVTEWGHGSTSRVLSDLHKAGRIVRLSEERERCKVYVLPEYVNGRETEPHGGKKSKALVEAEAAIQRVRDLHRKDRSTVFERDVCEYDRDTWPCETIEALGDQ